MSTLPPPCYSLALLRCTRATLGVSLRSTPWRLDQSLSSAIRIRLRCGSGRTMTTRRASNESYLLGAVKLAAVLGWREHSQVCAAVAPDMKGTPESAAQAGTQRLRVSLFTKISQRGFRFRYGNSKSSG